MSDAQISSELARPECSVELPGGVIVQWQDWRKCFEYCGRAENLVACGAVSADMLIMNTPRGPRRKRRDTDGDRYRITRYWRWTDERREPCAPYHWYWVSRFKKEATEHLPGSKEAVMAMMRYRRWEARRDQRQEVTQSAQVARPQLRLVVNNT